MVLFNINNITTLGLANNTSLTLSSWLLTLALVLNTKLQDGGKPMVLGGLQLLGATHFESFLTFSTL